MAKIAASFLLMISAFMSIAQTEAPVFINKDLAFHFFNSYEDFLARKPVEGITIKSIEGNGSSLQVLKNGTEEKVKDENITYSWFCNADGNLMRVFKGEVYYVTEVGSVCYFFKMSAAHFSVTVPAAGENTYVVNPIPGQGLILFESTTGVSGEIVKPAKGSFMDRLEKYGLKDEYDGKKITREAKDTKSDHENKGWNRDFYFLRKINEKMK